MASELLAMIAAMCARRQWPHTVLADQRAVVITHAWITPGFESRATVRDGGQVLAYGSTAAAATPPARLAEVARYLGLVNRELDVGSFELSCDDGVVRCKTGLALEGSAPTDALLQGVVLPNHQAMIHYHDDLLRVIRGEADAADAFADAMNR